VNTRRSTLIGTARRVGLLVLGALAFVTATGDLLAQGGPPRRDSSSRRGGRAIEQQLQQRIATIMKERMELDEAQLQQLVEVTRRFERERMQVRGEEYRMRVAMRAQLLAGDTASQERVAELLDRMPSVERRRIDLMEAEQRELAKFLTPVQRARYVALQEEIRRNMEEIRERRANSSSGSSSRQRGPPGSRP
jgi:Spy/CpxP family protein refolding chaperone